MKRRNTAIALLTTLALCGVACTQKSAETSTSVEPSTSPTSKAATVTTADKVLIPAATWNCYMPDGIPKPEAGTLLLEAEMQLDNVYDVGKTPYGQREVVVTQAGKMNGPKIQAEVLPGGLDFELTLPNGVVEVEQILVLRTSDNRYAIMRNAGTGATAKDVRVVYDFEASTTGDFAWLNTGKFVGRRVIDAAKKTMKISIYDVSNVSVQGDAAHGVHIDKPANVPAQPWDFRKPSPDEKQGDTIVTESVLLGGSQAVQAGKRGSRNVIPITGGTLTGTISGKVLFGGADYQSPGTGPAIDARYLWEATEGDVIIVRNTGPFNALVPTFETRVDGKYAWLNSGKYLSSPPGGGGRGGAGAGGFGGGFGGRGGAPGAGGPGRGAFGGAPGAGPGMQPGGVAGGAGRGPGGPGGGPGAGPGGGRGGPGGGGGLSISMYKSTE